MTYKTKYAKGYYYVLADDDGHREYYSVMGGNWNTVMANHNWPKRGEQRHEAIRQAIHGLGAATISEERYRLASHA